MPTVTLDDVVSHDPDTLLPPDEEFAAEYDSRVAAGEEAASKLDVCFTAICRNAMPWLPLTLDRVAKTASKFRSAKVFVFENDSQDGTDEFLRQAATENDWLEVKSTRNGRPHLNYTKSSERTVALAEYRNACREWVAEHCGSTDITVVFDTDPWGGWSIGGVMNTIGHLVDPAYESAAGMAAYSWCEWEMPHWFRREPCHYDAFACRWTWWREHLDMRWFHLWHPPVGSPPVRVNSAFGQLGVYRTRNYVLGRYEGGDCEHVSHWKTCGGGCFLNPSQRVVSFWVPRSDEEKQPA